MRDVSKEEMEAARDAVVAHANAHERTHMEAVLIFEELVRQLKFQAENNPNVKVVLN